MQHDVLLIANRDENSLLLKKQSLQLEAHWRDSFRTAQEPSKILILRELCKIFKKWESGYKCLSGVALNVKKQQSTRWQILQC